MSSTFSIAFAGLLLLLTLCFRPFVRLPPAVAVESVDWQRTTKRSSKSKMWSWRARTVGDEPQSDDAQFFADFGPFAADHLVYESGREGPFDRFSQSWLIVIGFDFSSMRVLLPSLLYLGLIPPSTNSTKNPCGSSSSVRAWK